MSGRFDLRGNTVATAGNVLAALRNGAPMTDSVEAAMPNLLNLLRSLDEVTLADEIEEAFAARIASVTL